MNQAANLAQTLYCGDNLPILRAHVADESVDLIYLDPPFYSQRNYQAFFKSLASNGHARAPAFADTWHWDAEVEQTYHALLAGVSPLVARSLIAMRDLLGTGPFLAYLIMMAVRLVELRRVLKPTGSVYLHCDPAASHYLKLLLDLVFGASNFRNEIVWSYKTGGASPRHFARKHDLIFFYSKSEQYTFHALKEKSYMMHRYGFKKSEFLRDERGQYTWVYMKDVWELPALGAADAQRLGYPTQKPEALLERVIRASSNEGDLVLDPFCGSGTTLVVAQRLDRFWAGIESHYLGIAYQRYRLACAFPNLSYLFTGGPTSVEEARQLAYTNSEQFRWWALSLLCARPVGGENNSHAEPQSRIAHGILPGRAGGAPLFLVVAPIDGPGIELLSRLRAAIEAGESSGALILTLDAPSPEIRAECGRSLSVHSHPLQILTIAELLQQTKKLASSPLRPESF